MCGHTCFCVHVFVSAFRFLGSMPLFETTPRSDHYTAISIPYPQPNGEGPLVLPGTYYRNHPPKPRGREAAQKGERSPDTTSSMVVILREAKETTWESGKYVSNDCINRGPGIMSHSTQ